MRAHFSLSSLRLIVAASALSLAAPVFAADINTYRAGQTYSANTTSSPQTCALQCSGDAQCYGWNFLRTGAPNGSGVCELNANVANAVGHPFAISGDNGGRSYGASSVVRGQARTYRIGNPEAARPQMQTKAAPTNLISAERRRVAPPVVRKRTFAPVAPNAQMRPQPQPTLPRTQQARPMATQQRPHQPQMQRARAHAPQQHMAPQTRDPRLQQASTPRRVAPQNAPVQARPQAQRQQIPPQAYPQRPNQAQHQSQPMAQSQQQRAPKAPNLFGSLYDVPKGPSAGQAVATLGRRKAAAMAQVKAAAQNPDLPMPTAVPTTPVSRETLEMAGPRQP